MERRMDSVLQDLRCMLSHVVGALPAHQTVVRSVRPVNELTFTCITV